MTENTTEPKRRQVFLSYSQADRDISRQVAEALEDAGLRVWIDAWELGAGDSVVERIDHEIAASDIVLFLLSKATVASRWMQEEITAAVSRDLQDRAVTMIPALIEDCEVPFVLADRPYIDLRRDPPTAIKRLVQQLSVIPDLDFSKLDGRTFDEMAIALLKSLGFSVQPAIQTGNSGFDFIAVHQSRDPFGAEQASTWLVQTKLYRDQRVSIAVLQQMFGYLRTTGSSEKGLVVTNGRLTSVARTFLRESIEASGREIRVIDGTELTSLLIQYPDIVQRYFHLSGSHD